jgi:PEP-CTERM motif
MIKFAFIAAMSAFAITPASAAVYMTEGAFDAANPVSSTLTFNGVGLGTNQGPVYSQGGVTFTGNALLLIGTSFWGSVNSLADNAFNGSIQADFAATDAVGFYFASNYGNGTPVALTVFNGATQVFASTLTGGGVQTAFSFFGLDGVGPITRFRLNSAGTGGFVSVGPITFASNGAVPEPASWALMIAGFCLVGSALRKGYGRRRKPSVSVSFA